MRGNMQSVEASVPARPHRRQDIFTPLLVFGATRLALALAIWAGQVLLPVSTAPGVWFAFPRQLVLDGLVRWDAGWYLLVAQQGYHFDPTQPALTPPVLPLFPALLRLVSLVLRDLALSGLVVANVAFAASLVVLFRELRRRFDAALALRTIVFLSLFPFGFLFSAADPASLTLLLAVATFALLERGRPFAAACTAALAALASPTGLVLWPALVVWHATRFARKGGSVAALAGLALPPLAAGAFGAYLYFGVGEPIDLVRATLLGETSFSLLDGNLVPISLVPPETARFWPVLAIGALLGVSTFAAAAFSARLLGLPYATFTALAVVLPALLGFDAFGRSVAIAFPACVVMAYLCRRQLSENIVVVSFSLLLGLLCLLYAGWHPVTRAASAISPARDQMSQVLPGAARQASDTASRLDVELPNVLRFLGYNSPGRGTPGQQLSFQLDIQTLRPTTRPYVVAVHLNDQTGRTWAKTVQLLGGTSWDLGLTAGDVTRLPVAVAIDPDVPSGAYVAVLLMFDHETWEWLPFVDSKTGRTKPANLGEIVILGQEDAPDQRAFRPQYTASAGLGGQFALRGYDLSPATVPPGGVLTVTLYWEGLARPEFDYTIFVQLLDERGVLVTQSDSYPLDGRFPTSRWQRGELVRDAHAITIPVGLRPGALTLIAGMYRLETMQRLAAIDQSGDKVGDFVTLGQIESGGR